jgi:hypothetical protein
MPQCTRHLPCVKQEALMLNLTLALLTTTVNLVQFAANLTLPRAQGFPEAPITETTHKYRGRGLG